MRPGIVVAAGLAGLAALAGAFALGRLTHPPVGGKPPVAAGARPVLYWYDPMLPGQHFDKPGKSPFMDMQLVPKYAGDEPGAGTEGVRIDPARAQSLGVRVAVVSRQPFGESITAPAVLDFNQRDVAIVQARSGGFVQRVYGRAPGDVVAAGAPIVDLMVPEWSGAQTEFLAVRKAEDPALVAAARQRLGLLGMPPAVIAQVERSGRPQPVFTVTAPVGGMIRTLGVRAGMTVTAGQSLAEINGLGVIWATASVPPAIAGTLRAGQAAEVSLSSDPTRSLRGRVAAILPEVSGDTRTVQVRVELPNAGGRLRPGGFATIAFAGTSRSALVVPSEAVIRTGKRTLIMLALPEGRYQPAEVQVGADAGGNTEVISGLSEGDKVVASGQFLLDAEASMSGIQTRTSGPAPAASPATSAIYETTGRIERLEPASVTLSHAPVPALQWPAMTMTFRIQQPAMAQGFEVGDRVRFAFDQPKEGPTVRRMAKEPAR